MSSARSQPMWLLTVCLIVLTAQAARAGLVRSRKRVVVNVLLQLGFMGLVFPAHVMAGFDGLGNLPPGGNGGVGTTADALSGDGSTVVGVTGLLFDHSEAYRATRGGSFQPFGNMLPPSGRSFPSDVNHDGSVIVGTTNVGLAQTAFRWSAVSGFTDLGVLPGDAESQALAVSGDGLTVIGRSMMPILLPSGYVSYEQHAFRWTPSGGLAPLSGINDVSSSSIASGISADGNTIVGSAVTAVGRQGYRWSQSGGPTFLGVGMGVSDISADGSTLLGSDNSGPPWLGGNWPCRWDAGGNKVRLGELPGVIMVGLSTNAVSGDGSTVVGNSFVQYFRPDGQLASENWPVIWDEDSVARDLRTVLATQYGFSLSGWTDLSVSDISDDGLTLLGEGYRAGVRQPWVAVVPEPSSLLGILLGMWTISQPRCRRPRRCASGSRRGDS